MKRKIFLFFILFSMILPCSVRADHLYNVSMDINLLEDGSADIRETWVVKADSGTEWYKQLYNLGNS